MSDRSPFLDMQDLERQIKSILRLVDPDTLSMDERKILGNIRRWAVDARIYIRDYELSETRDEQVKKAVLGKRRLTRLDKAIVALGSVFGPADVAHLSAQADKISSSLI